MTLEHDLAVCINQNDVWNALNFKILVCSARAVSSQIVLDIGPALVCDVLFELIQVLVERKPNYSNFVAPFLFVVSKHLLVVSHRCLTRWAPSCPEVVQNYLTWLVDYVSLASLEHVAYTLNHSDMITLFFSHIIQLQLRAHFYYIVNQRVKLFQFSIRKFFNFTKSCKSCNRTTNIASFP